MSKPSTRQLPPIALDVSVPPVATAMLVELICSGIETSLKQVLEQTPVLTQPVPEQPKTTVPLEKSTPGTELQPSEKLKAADLRTAILLGKVPEGTGLLVDVKTLSQLLNVSARHLHRLLDLKAIPEPVRLGRLLRWRLTEVLEWIDESCPPQRDWRYRRTFDSRKKGK